MIDKLVKLDLKGIRFYFWGRLIAIGGSYVAHITLPFSIVGRVLMLYGIMTLAKHNAYMQKARFWALVDTGIWGFQLSLVLLNKTAVVERYFLNFQFTIFMLSGIINLVKAYYLMYGLRDLAVMRGEHPMAIRSRNLYNKAKVFLYAGIVAPFLLQVPHMPTIWYVIMSSMTGIVMLCMIALFIQWMVYLWRFQHHLSKNGAQWLQ